MTDAWFEDCGLWHVGGPSFVTHGAGRWLSCLSESQEASHPPTGVQNRIGLGLAEVGLGDGIELEHAGGHEAAGVFGLVEEVEEALLAGSLDD